MEHELSEVSELLGCPEPKILGNGADSLSWGTGNKDVFSVSECFKTLSLQSHKKPSKLGIDLPKKKI